MFNKRISIHTSITEVCAVYAPVMLQVLRRCGYVGNDDTVQLKGRVTCELHSHEVLLTELIFQNVFVDYSPAEIAALLSAVIFQQVIWMWHYSSHAADFIFLCYAMQAKCSEPNLTERLQKVGASKNLVQHMHDTWVKISLVYTILFLTLLELLYNDYPSVFRARKQYWEYQKN